MKKSPAEETRTLSVKRVPERPVWAVVYRNCTYTPDWRDQELVAVTRHTLHLARAALRQKMALDYYHNDGAAEREINEVLELANDGR